MVTGLASLISAGVSLLLPVYYTATTRIMTPQPTPSAAVLMASQFSRIQGDTLSVLGGASALGLKNPNDIYLGLLNARPIADALVRRFALQQEYHTRNMTDTRKALAANTHMISEKSGLIAIAVTDPDKSRAAELANAYTEELRILTKSLAATEAEQRRIFYDEQLKHAREDLVAAQFSVQQIQHKKGVVQPEAQAKSLLEGLTALQARIAAKKVEVQALRSYSTGRNPDVQLAENELASLQSEAQRLMQSTHSDNAANLGLGDVAGAGMEFLSAQRELEYRQILFELLLKQYDAARLDESRNAAIVQVVEPAIAPDQRSAPRRTAIVILTSGLAFLFTCLYVLAASFVAKHEAIACALREFGDAALRRKA
jgi:uncharacterized protein involved in exopolysaccharide biosynthesis